MFDMFQKGAAAAVLALAVSTGGAQAATIMASGTSITVDCIGAATQECSGFVGGSLTTGGSGQIKVNGGTMGSLSNTSSDLFNLGGSSPENEAQALDFLLDGIDNDEFTTGTQVAATNGDSMTFSSNAEYLAIKVGKDHFFLALTGPGPITINFDKNRQKGGGLSHYTEFGTLAAVPLPAAGLLMLLGLGGLGAMRRRR